MLFVDDCTNHSIVIVIIYIPHKGHEEHPAVKSKDTRRQKKRKKKVSESTPVSYQFVFEPEDTPGITPSH